MFDIDLSKIEMSLCKLKICLLKEKDNFIGKRKQETVVLFTNGVLNNN